MKSQQFFIKAGYIHNDIAMTSDSVSHSEYWDKERQITSSYYQMPVYSFAIRVMIERKLRTLLDVGCGVGTKLAMVNNALPEVEIIGVDQPMAIRFCREKYNFGKWYVDDLECPGQSLSEIRGDLVICADVIEHLVNPDILLEYLKKKVCRGGYVLLSTPDRDKLRGKDCMSSPNKCHVREWNYGELGNYLLYSGFEIVDHFRQYPMSFGLNMVVVRELFKRVISWKALKYNQVCLLRVK